MALKKMTLESIKDLDDGRVIAAFEMELKRAVLDCMDRSGDKNSRTVNMEFKLTPVCGEDGQCEGVTGEFHIKSKVPVRKTKTYSFDVNRAGQLVYSSNNPEDINQPTIDDMRPDGTIERKEE
jgi:hypothetical protein